MFVSLTYVGVFGVIFLLLTYLYYLEDVRGKRLVFPRIRSFLDKIVSSIYNLVVGSLNKFWRQFVRMLFHYGAHTFLKRVLTFIRNLEVKLENLMRQNKAVARDLSEDRVRNHLDEIADHKVSSALSDKEREKMKSH